MLVPSTCLLLSFQPTARASSSFPAGFQPPCGGYPLAPRPFGLYNNADTRLCNTDFPRPEYSLEHGPEPRPCPALQRENLIQQESCPNWS